MLAEMLGKIARDYANERMKPFSNSDFGNFVRRDVATEAKKQLFGKPYELKLKASVGAGNWAAVPWLAFFDPLETETATKGFYVVYLINPQTRTVTLSMNQGTTAVYKEFGRLNGRQVLQRRALDMAQRVPEYAALFDTGTIDLGSDEDLPSGYIAGHSFGRTYSLSDLNEKVVCDDLEKMLAAYQTLIERGGSTPSDIMYAEANSSNIDETRRYVLSRKIERSGKVCREVLSVRKAVCECCGLDPQIDSNYRGPTINTPLDVHHCAPLQTVSEGQTKRYIVPDDFLVLCPTCHRMIHKQMDTSDVDHLKEQMRFKYLRLILP